MEWKIETEWRIEQETLTEEERAEVQARVGFALVTLIEADPGTEEWPEEEYPREAAILIQAREEDDLTAADRFPFVVYSQAPDWYGEGSAAPIVRNEDGSLAVWL